ncbi:DUF928 domain-containing protein [Aerosakkonema funiforme]|uniref:DUF928 domain-containing protein n=1 Tax=Aerosakkonema funiforme FACHB-1375 TaxID=2949571 RepID=A0A926VES0_9CYAN|nr:DUF928 domain-containing protein [Aerosakkonema funiforme]MBD2182596.1 DUF928 domain-containing protein [Aerosakkonema funiforme FACHB-1375]
MKNFSFNQLLFFVAVCLGAAVLLRFVTQLQAPALAKQATSREAIDEVIRIDFEPPPDAPGEPKQSAPGGTRGKCKQSENSPDPTLTLLIPASSQVRTIAEHPTFFVYVPSTSAQSGELVIKEKINPDETQVIYQKIFPLTGIPGIASFTLPDHANKLEIGKNYQWSFALICNSEDRSGDLVRFATIERTEISPNLAKQLENAKPIERAALYAKNGIWPETLITLAELRRSQPENSSLKIMWEELLKSESVKLTDIAEEPLVECCKPQELNSTTNQ